MTRITRDNWMEVWRMGYNVACNPIGTVPNAPLSSAQGKELHPPILSTLVIHGGQVKRDTVAEIIYSLVLKSVIPVIIFQDYYYLMRYKWVSSLYVLCILKIYHYSFITDTNIMSYLQNFKICVKFHLQRSFWYPSCN